MQTVHFEKYAIETAQESDVNEVVKLLHKTVDFAYTPVYPKEGVAYFKQHHNHDLIAEKINNSHYLIGKAGDKIIATGCLKEDYIGGVYVLPEYQGKKIGREIMRLLMVKAKREGVDLVYLNASVPSKNFYNKLGFHVREEVQMPLPNNQVLLYWVMEKEI
jgi:ribosomal protein S18 acetylase RimI-like enzyme